MLPVVERATGGDRVDKVVSVAEMGESVVAVVMAKEVAVDSVVGQVGDVVDTPVGIMVALVMVEVVEAAQPELESMVLAVVPMGAAESEGVLAWGQSTRGRRKSPSSSLRTL